MGALTGLQRRAIYFPDRSAVPPAAQVAPGGRDVVLHTDDGLDLQAWLLPPPPGVADRGVGVLYAPGNGGNRAGRRRRRGAPRAPLLTAPAGRCLPLSAVADSCPTVASPSGLILPASCRLFVRLSAAQCSVTAGDSTALATIASSAVTIRGCDRAPARTAARMWRAGRGSPCSGTRCTA